MARIATLNTEGKSFLLQLFSYSVVRQNIGYKADGNPEVGDPAPGVISFQVAKDDDAFFYQKSGSKPAVLAGSITIKDEGTEKMNLTFEGGRIVSYSEVWHGSNRGEQSSQDYNIILSVKSIKMKQTTVPAA